jgi:hypothetical protein
MDSVIANYAATKAAALAIAPFSFTGSAVLTVANATQAAALFAARVVRNGQTSPPASITWQTTNPPASYPTFATLTIAQQASIAAALADYLAAIIATLAGILAGPATSTYQVDTAAWPVAAATI